jgi:site-specific recombinase XerD
MAQLIACASPKIQKKVSWHTFRHTFSTLLKGNGEDVKVV